nr:unnamed protein product [Digitaria exilis]
MGLQLQAYQHRTADPFRHPPLFFLIAPTTAAARIKASKQQPPILASSILVSHRSPSSSASQSRAAQHTAPQPPWAMAQVTGRRRGKQVVPMRDVGLERLQGDWGCRMRAPAVHPQQQPHRRIRSPWPACEAATGSAAVQHQQHLRAAARRTPWLADPLKLFHVGIPGQLLVQQADLVAGVQLDRGRAAS